MSRASVRQRGATHEGQYIKKINNMYASIDNYTKILAEVMLYDLCQFMAQNILAAGKSARLDACDDKIYDCYIGLMAAYRNAAANYEEMSDVLVSPKVKSTLEGIYSILKSRLGLHDNGRSEDGFADNPIFVEKKAIINNGVEEFIKQCGVLSKEFLADKLWVLQKNAREVFMGDGLSYDEKGIKVVGNIADLQDECLYGKVYELFQDTVKLCMTKLNDIDSRTAVLMYNELLDQEQEILGSIVKIQIPILEQDKCCSPTEESVVEGIIQIIKNGHDELSLGMSGINRSMRESRGNTPDECTREHMAECLKAPKALQGILSSTNFAGFVKSQQFEQAEVDRALEAELGIAIEKDLANRSYARAMYGYRKTIASHAFMAEEMLEVFEMVLKACQIQFDELENADERAILQGISETMQIKLESLRENKEQFSEEAQSKIDELRPEKPQISLADFKGINPMTDMERKEAVFGAYRNKMQKHMQAHEDYANKKALAFKKDYLIFEAVTFEEILTYSVSRIRESENEQVKELVNTIDKSWEKLQAVLEKNGLTPIRPKPHDIFNGKEHEVLTVEKNPDFKKGEIIKLMNCGYKQGDMVLARANIVAAI